MNNQTIIVVAIALVSLILFGATTMTGTKIAHGSMLCLQVCVDTTDITNSSNPCLPNALVQTTLADNLTNAINVPFFPFMCVTFVQTNPSTIVARYNDSNIHDAKGAGMSVTATGIEAMIDTSAAKYGWHIITHNNDGRKTVDTLAPTK